MKSSFYFSNSSLHNNDHKIHESSTSSAIVDCDRKDEAYPADSTTKAVASIPSYNTNRNNTLAFCKVLPSMTLTMMTTPTLSDSATRVLTSCQTIDELIQAGLKLEVTHYPTEAPQSWFVDPDGIVKKEFVDTTFKTSHTSSSPAKNNNENNNQRSLMVEAVDNGPMWSLNKTTSSDGYTVLPATNWTIMSIEDLLKILELWIAVMHLGTTISDDSGHQTRPFFHTTIEKKSGVKGPRHPAQISRYASPQHFKIYHRLASILLGLVACADSTTAIYSDKPKTMEAQQQPLTTCTTSSNTDNSHKKTSLMILRHIRSLAQRILHMGRMKGESGATHYYCWFTAVAAECSEALGDTYCAHLAYKSIWKLENSTTIDTTTKKNAVVSIASNINHGSNGDSCYIPCLVYGSDDQRDVDTSVLLGMWNANPTCGNNASGRSAIRMLGRERDNTIPPTTTFLSSSASSNGTNNPITWTDSKIGNTWVAPGTLSERIRRTHTANMKSQKRTKARCCQHLSTTNLPWDCR